MPDIKKIYTGDGTDRSAVIEIDDEIVGLNQFNTLSDLVSDEMKEGIKSFTFDLSRLNTINSSGLGILISCLKKVKDSGGSLKIINVNEKILNIFKLTKLDNVFEIKTSA
ncbi:MAG: STAS domain-containing protein [Ignavibacteria bacterium]|nr:STAS domain-containing protein [Ignavibacteria bacterium]